MNRYFFSEFVEINLDQVIKGWVNVSSTYQITLNGNLTFLKQTRKNTYILRAFFTGRAIHVNNSILSLDF